MTRADALALSFAAAGTAAALAGPWPVLAAGGILGALLADGVARPASRVLLDVIWRGPRGRRAVALTFDDGPDPEITPRVADALCAAGARATFFCIGRHLEQHADLGRRLAAEGHEIGNHSYSHSRLLNFRGPRSMGAEIARGAEAIRSLHVAAVRSAALPSPARAESPLYRPPLGLKNPALAALAASRRLRVVTWSLHGRDTGGAGAGAIAARVLDRVRPGDIVLLHDACDRPGADRRPTADAVPAILAGLGQRDLRCVTVSDLIFGGPQQEPLATPAASV